jgi:hypothetical protein
MKTIFAEDSIASQKERDRILLQVEISRAEKPTRPRKTRETGKKELYSIQRLAPGPFPFQEKPESGRISSNLRNK